MSNQVPTRYGIQPLPVDPCCRRYILLPEEDFGRHLLPLWLMRQYPRIQQLSQPTGEPI